MKLKRVRIAIEPLSRTQARWKKALRGKAVSDSRRTVITVPSWEVLGKVLSPRRLEILARIPVLKPRSIAALARSLERDFKYVHADVVFLANLGLIKLKAEGRRKTLVPIARFGGIEVDLGNAA
jgi:predicted transcriptional regulator